MAAIARLASVCSLPARRRSGCGRGFLLRLEYHRLKSPRSTAASVAGLSVKQPCRRCGCSTSKRRSSTTGNALSSSASPRVRPQHPAWTRTRYPTKGSSPCRRSGRVSTHRRLRGRGGTGCWRAWRSRSSHLPRHWRFATSVRRLYERSGRRSLHQPRLNRGLARRDGRIVPPNAHGGHGVPQLPPSDLGPPRSPPLRLSRRARRLRLRRCQRP